MNVPGRAVLVRPLALVAGLFAFACGSTGQVSPVPSGNTHATTAFIFHYTPADASLVPAIAAAANAHHARITGDLAVNGMRQVHVYYYESREALRAAARPFAGNIPEWATGLVSGPDGIHLVSPTALGQSVEQASSSVVHEFAHCATLSLEPRAGNNPRWLWESVATYESRQFVDPRGLSYLAAHERLTLSDLSSIGNRRIYEVGFLIGEFIVTTWNQGTLPRLISAFGDTRAVLGLSETEFERQWLDFVTTRYGI